MRSYIHLIRHGITEGNKKQWYYGRSDIPLIEEGYEGLRKLKEEGVYPKIDDDTLIFTSGLVRTSQTLDAIYGIRDSIIIDKLREWDCGDFECRSHEELTANPEYRKWFETRTFDSQVPGGESMRSFYERVSEGFDVLMTDHELQMIKLRNRPKDAVSLAVIHGAVICSIMSRFFGNGLGDGYWSWLPDPGRGYTIEMEDGRISEYTKI
ncbi:MAG: histidine phosphatase family protein [Anaerovoracaceae bacterium]